MAFEDGLGVDPSQPQEEDYVLSATGIMWKTLNLWKRKFVQYIVLVGLVSILTAFFSFILIFTVFGLIGVLPEDPINYVFGIFVLSTPPDVTIIAITIIFGVIAFVINAILSGAAIKFALDDYGGQVAEVGESFSHSFRKTAQIVTVQLIMTLIVSAVTGPSLGLLTRALDEIDFDPYNPTYPPTISPEAMQYLFMGMGLLIVGGIIVLFISIRFAPAVAIIMDTDLSAIDSLKRSWELTSGKFIHVFSAQFCIAIAVGFLSLIVTFPIGLILFLNPYAIVIETILIGLLFSAPSLIFIAVLYRDLLARGGPVGVDLPEYVL